MLSSLTSAGMCFSKCILSYTVYGLDKCVCNVCVYMHIHMYVCIKPVYLCILDLCVYVCLCMLMYLCTYVHIYVCMYAFSMILDTCIHACACYFKVG